MNARSGCRPHQRVPSRNIWTRPARKHRVSSGYLVYSATHGISVFARNDDYFLGVPQSRSSNCGHFGRATGWASATILHIRFAVHLLRDLPFPWPPGKETERSSAQAIAAAAKELVEQRDAWLETRPVQANLNSRSVRSPTCTTNGLPGWTNFTGGLTPQSSMRTPAGRTIRPTIRSWSGCWR